MTIESLPFPKGRKPIDYTLTETLHLSNVSVPKGEIIKLLTTANFGFVVLPVQYAGKRIHKY